MDRHPEDVCARRGRPQDARGPVSAAEAPPEADGPVPAADGRGHGLVLIVDDEDLICRVVSQMVECLGFETISVNSGRAALDLFRLRHPDVVAVLLDESMPNQTGSEVFAEMQKIRPDVKVVLCTGHSEAGAMRRSGRGRLAGYLQKPFTIDALTATLRAIRESKAAGEKEGGGERT